MPLTPSERAAASKTAQEIEASQRARTAEGDPAETAALNTQALNVDTDSEPTTESPPLVPAADPAEDIRPEPVSRSPNDILRDEIAKNFRVRRSADDTEADADAQELRNLAGLPPEFRDVVVAEEPTAEPEPQAQSRAEPPQQQQPQRRLVKVRGEERWLTDEEILAAAQKTLAADDYLGEARAALDAAKQARTEIEALRTGPTGTHPPGQIVPQDGDPSAHPVADPFEGIIEKLQYGDPKEAASELRNLFSTTVPAMSAEQITRQRVADEHNRSMRTLAEFQDANPDLANDEMTQAAIRSRLFALQRDDLVKAGVDPAKLPNNPDVIANAHLQFRAEGKRVRSVTDLLTAAKSDYEAWRGTGKQSAATDPASPPAQAAATTVAQAAPRIEVNVDRTVRRQAIPQQPTRTVAPKPDAQTQAQPTDRSSVVARMQQRHAALRNGLRTGARV